MDPGSTSEALAAIPGIVEVLESLVKRVDALERLPGGPLHGGRCIAVSCIVASALQVLRSADTPLKFEVSGDERYAKEMRANGKLVFYKGLTLMDVVSGPEPVFKKYVPTFVDAAIVSFHDEYYVGLEKSIKDAKPDDWVRPTDGKCRPAIVSFVVRVGGGTSTLLFALDFPSTQPRTPNDVAGRVIDEIWRRWPIWDSA